MIFKRPWLVLLLLVITLVFTVSAAARVWNGVAHFRFLDDLPIPVSPLYFVISGVIWCLIGAVAAILVWWGNQHAQLILIGGALIYGTFFWVEQLFLMSNPLRKTNWPFLAAFTLIVILVVILSFRHPKVRNFYGGQV